MKFFRSKKYAHHGGAAVVAVAAALCLSSCEEKEPETAPAAPVEKPAEPAAAPQVDMLAESRQALFEYAVYTLGKKVTSPETFPELNSIVKDMLEKMRAYYTELQKGEPSEERARLALQIATTTRDLGAYSKAQAEFENALKEAESLPEELKKTPAVQRMLSACNNGLGVCLLSQRKFAEALQRYEAALAVDEELFKAVAPADGAALPPGEVEPAISRASTDLLDSYRCLGDCYRAMDDPEEARTTYAKGQAVAQQLKRLSSDMSIAYVKLLTALGNLDNSQGRTKGAMESWVMAAKICQSLNASSPKLDVKAETKRCFDALLPAIQSVSQAMKAEQEAQERRAAEEKAAAEKAAAEAAAAEKAAAERLAAEQAAQEAARKQAEEQAAAEKAAQEEANKRVRKSRRRN